MLGREHTGPWLSNNMTSATLFPVLTAADRCDRCGARAYLRVILRNGELLFCAHHGRTHMPQLDETALDIQDFTDLILTD
jgi:hypothetical protein